MKVALSALLLTVTLPTACSVPENLGSITEVSSSDAAANQLYLDDMVDSAADESTSTEVDDSVASDTKAARLEQMVSKLITELDADASGSLSLAEFLVAADKRAAEQELDDATKARIVAKMTEDFTAYAGDDEILSSDELKTLLKAVAPRVGCHRQENFPGQQEERVQKTWDDLIAEFDADGDGLLSQTEYEAMEAARKAEGPGRGQGGGPGQGQGQGQGGPAPKGR